MNFKALAIRSLVALFLGPVIIGFVWLGGYFILTLVIIVTVLSYWEYTRLLNKKGVSPQLIAGEIIVLIVSLCLFYNQKILIPVILLAIIVVFFTELYRKKESPLLNAPATLSGALYFSLLFGCFILIRELPLKYNFDYVEAGQWLILIIFSTWVCDTAAYVFGSYFGKHKLMARISPNKTIEGSIAGFIFAVLTAFICHLWFIDELSLLDSIVFGAIVGSFGQYGDLLESMLKRDANVKDTSNLIPGHGGMMDRFDSLTISAPIIYLYLTFFVY